MQNKTKYSIPEWIFGRGDFGRKGNRWSGFGGMRDIQGMGRFGFDTNLALLGPRMALLTPSP
jgi:hypothetical protein